MADLLWTVCARKEGSGNNLFSGSSDSSRANSLRYQQMLRRSTLTPRPVVRPILAFTIQRQSAYVSCAATVSLPQTHCSAEFATILQPVHEAVYLALASI
jgi:hypothetical protein